MPSPGHDPLRQAFDLQRRGRRVEAEELYHQILKQQPRNPQALHFLGVLTLEKQQTEQGVELIRQALAIHPGYAQAYGSLALGLETLGRHEDALASYGKLIGLMPGHAGALYNRGRILHALGRYEAALADFDRALALHPSAAALVDRGVTLMRLQRSDEAMASFDHAVALDPGLAVAHYNRGLALMQQQPESALAAFDRAIACRQDYAEAIVYRGNMLRALNRAEESLAEMDRAIALKPDFAQAHDNRGVTLVELERMAEALASYDRALALDAGYIHARFNKSLALLLMGRFPEGWRLYDSRKQLEGWPGPRVFSQPAWDGAQDIAGRTLFLHWEQGLGDTIQFCRYAALAATRGAKIVLCVQDRLVRLLKNFAPGVDVVGQTSMPDPYDMQACLLDLPLAFGATAEGVAPLQAPLAAEPERVHRWKERIGDKGFRIGIAWQGNRPRNPAPSRSFPLTCLRHISTMAGVRLISLQKNEGTGQIAASGMSVEQLGEDFDAGPDAFVDTAAVMMHCDLIITCDTSIAHLAGALARPVWVALNRVPEWRWQLERSDSPWYPTMTLFRQRIRGDWDSVFAAMERALASRLAPSAQSHIL